MRRVLNSVFYMPGGRVDNDLSFVSGIRQPVLLVNASDWTIEEILKLS